MMLHIQQSNNLISDMTMFDLQDELEERSKLNLKSDEDKSDAKIPRSQIDSETPMQKKSNSICLIYIDTVVLKVNLCAAPNLLL